ncbi:hypothetical protein DUI87_05095 [Hirundo rustica rustica]|uniref:ribonuclease H n=1 Tax=Hirundo rustica rustica TaxID=333673 RepID=A0A3M0L332_HIRRU|nr:hypothetical protein DUI87_05095 [Hirundo rustica rustica]
MGKLGPGHIQLSSPTKNLGEAPGTSTGDPPHQDQPCTSPFLPVPVETEQRKTVELLFKRRPSLFKFVIPPLRLTEGLHLKDSNWKLVSVNNGTLVGESPDGPIRPHQWGVTIDIPDPSQYFWVAATEERPTRKTNWKTDSPVWVEQWPLSKQKLKVLEELVEEQLAKGHIVETTSPWNSPVFVIRKPGKDKWRRLQNLRQINNVIEDMGSLQPGMPSPTMLPQNWKLAVIDIKDCFFQIPQHPDDAPILHSWFPPLTERPQGNATSVRIATEKAIIHHYMDDVLVYAPTDDVLSHTLDLTINALLVAGFELQEDKVQRMPPWRYLGLEIGKRTIVPQKLEIKAKIKTLADVHQLCGALNWVRPWLGLTTDDLAPLFNLLKGGEELSSPRELTPEVKEALEKIQHLMFTWQAHRCDPDLPFKFITMGKLPHLHGVIFQRRNNIKMDQGREDPLLIIE